MLKTIAQSIRSQKPAWINGLFGKIFTLWIFLLGIWMHSYFMVHELSIYNFIKIDAIKNLANNTEDKYQNYIALRYAHNKKARLISFYMIIGGIILISAAKLIEIGNPGWSTKFM